MLCAGHMHAAGRHISGLYFGIGTIWYEFVPRLPGLSRMPRQSGTPARCAGLLRTGLSRLSRLP
jgi:hypothetical protein